MNSQSNHYERGRGGEGEGEGERESYPMLKVMGCCFNVYVYKSFVSVSSILTDV